VAGRNRVPSPAAGMTAVRTSILGMLWREVGPLALAVEHFDC